MGNLFKEMGKELTQSSKYIKLILVILLEFETEMGKELIQKTEYCKIILVYFKKWKRKWRRKKNIEKQSWLYLKKWKKNRQSETNIETLYLRSEKSTDTEKWIQESNIGHIWINGKITIKGNKYWKIMLIIFKEMAKELTQNNKYCKIISVTLKNGERNDTEEEILQILILVIFQEIEKGLIQESKYCKIILVIFKIMEKADKEKQIMQNNHGYI